MIKKIGSFLGTVVFFSGLALWWIGKLNAETLMNPLSLVQDVKKDRGEYKIVGFIPSWMIGKTMEYGKEIDDLIFLGVGVSENGNLIWDLQAKKINNENYLKIKDNVKKYKGNNILGIKQFNDDSLEELIKNKDAWQVLVDDIKKLDGFDGINVDFEYMGSSTKVLEPEFVEFLSYLKQSNIGSVSVDVFANTIIKGNKENLPKFINSVDEVIVMDYDFHRPGVDYAGPVAPIRAPVGERSIWEVVERISVLELDRKKIIFAYPLYGYEWKTESKEFGSKIKRGWYQMASLRRLEEEIIPSLKNQNGEEKWDEISMSPWLYFEENGEIRQIYYENWRSLVAKIDIVKQQKLGGLGFWALGYETKNEKFWGKISNELTK